MVTQQNTQNKNNLFRKEALQKVASPEQLDQLIKVTNPKRWFSLLGLSFLVTTGLAWSIFGRIPMLVKGRGVLIYPSKVSTVQASNTGRILTLNVQVGDRVKKGEVLATIDRSELQKQLQLSRDKLTQLQLQDQTANILQTQRYGLETSAIIKQRETLEKSLETVKFLTPQLRKQVQEVIKQERQNLQQRIGTLQDLLPTYYQRWQKREQLFKQGAVTQDLALQAQQDYKNAQTQINEAKSQLHQLDLKQTDAERQYMNNLNQVNELQAELKALESRQASQQEQDLTTATNRKKEIQETQRLIAQLELQLKKSSQIISDYTGTILEITAKPGQQLESGGGIATIAAQEPSAKLVNVAFLPVSEGKKIKPGMSLQITPSTVKREEFGGIEGKVTKISAFPVTQKGAASLVGNPDILPGIMTQEAQIAVFTELKPDTSTISGYKWSSSGGPDLKITYGTTTSVRIKVEEKAPITFVLPILKDWTGMG